MDTVSQMLDRRTTKSRSVIFGAIRSVGQREIAAKLGMSESALSEWLTKYGDRVAQLLTAVDLKPVSVGSKCVTPERAREIEDEFQRLHYWASKGMASQKALQIMEPEDTGIHWDTTR